jgi:hypothetical protein
MIRSARGVRCCLGNYRTGEENNHGGTEARRGKGEFLISLCLYGEIFIIV